MLLHKVLFFCYVSGLTSGDRFGNVSYITVHVFQDVCNFFVCVLIVEWLNVLLHVLYTSYTVPSQLALDNLQFLLLLFSSSLAFLQMNSTASLKLHRLVVYWMLSPDKGLFQLTHPNSVLLVQLLRSTCCLITVCLGDRRFNIVELTSYARHNNKCSVVKKVSWICLF